MKRKLLCGAALAALFSVSAGAQTCASPDTTWRPDPTGTPPLVGTTCGHETGILSACQANFGAPQQAYVAKITPQATGTFQNIAITGGAGYNIAVYVVDAAGAGACNGGGDTGVCKTSGSASSPIKHANLTDGNSYYVIVTGADFDPANACGPFQLKADGSLPVTLQDFTVG